MMEVDDFYGTKIRISKNEFDPDPHIMNINT